MNLLIGQPPRPDLGKGGSIVIGDLSEEELGALCEGLRGGWDYANEREQTILLLFEEQLLALRDSGAFRSPTAEQAEGEEQIPPAADEAGDEGE